ncbi:MAG: hemin uptake protein HemP [Planctomycetes bacterium]|nr:hemin uptake protein HemP [Planctomycetota bacterium]
MDDSKPKPDENVAKPAEPPPIIQAAALFHGQREVWIEHAGVRYRLQITRRNRLILQK